MQVYDLTMMAAINALECGPRKLSITGKWKWLLAEFASTYGIRASYAVLSHMRWVMRYDAWPWGCAATPACMRCCLVLACCQNHCDLNGVISDHGSQEDLLPCRQLKDLRLIDIYAACRPDNATGTADCLKLLCVSLAPLEKQQSENTLLPQVSFPLMSAMPHE